MPQLRQPRTLEEAAMNALVSCLSARCNEIEEAEYRDPIYAESETLRLAAEFNHSLPGVVLGKFVVPAVSHIMRSVVRDRFYKGIPTMLRCLLQPSLVEVDLSGLFFKCRLPADVNRSISGLLPVALAQMKHLRSLNLTAKATNEILHVLCRHCPELRDLNVAYSEIDDDGLQLLGAPPVGGGDVDAGCQKLSTLSVYKCWHVTPKAVARVLRDLKMLSRLDYDDCVSAIRVLYVRRRSRGRKRTIAEVSDGENGSGVGVVDGDGDGNGDKDEPASPWCLADGNNPSGDPEVPPVFRLTHLDQTAKRFQPGEDFMAYLVTAFPKVESFSLLTHDEDQLTELPRFPALNAVSVEIGRGPAGQVFRAFAAAMGPRLVSLNLMCEDLPVLSMVAIGTHCPNLRQLKIVRRYSSGSVLHYPRHLTGAFRQLELFNLTASGHEEQVSLEEWSYPLRHAVNLRELHFIGITYILTDAFWVDFLENTNKLAELEVLRMSGGQGHLDMGLTTARAFVESCPKLRRMAVSFWGGVTDAQFCQFEEELKRRNYDIELL